MTAKFTGRQGEYLVAAFLCGQGWHPTLTDAEGYDLIATRDPHILRVQVKACSSARPPKENCRPRYGWTVGIGGKKQIDDPVAAYDVLALAALDRNQFRFIRSDEIRKKTFRFLPEDMDDERSRDTWNAVVESLR